MKDKTNKHAAMHTIKPFWFLIVGFALLVFVLVVMARGNQHKQALGFETSDTALVAAAKQTFAHPLTGLSMTEPILLPQVFGVMIDNHESARPQSGIDEAFLVIEAPVEAGIPRFLAFFTDDQKDVEKIGPVRSARPYFLDWNAEFDALYVHVGGSNEALAKISSGDTFDLNQFWHDDFFWRSENRLAPYNVFTSTTLLKAFVEKRQDDEKAREFLYAPTLFGTATAESFEPQEVTLHFYPSDDPVRWRFNTASHRYERFHGSVAHRVSNGTQLQADTILIIVTDMRILDSVGRRSIQTTGKGKAWLLQNGHSLEGEWVKLSASERLRFVDNEGKEVPITPGVTWIEVLPSEEDIVITSE